MLVEFLTNDEAAAYGRYAEDPSHADLERVFLLDEEDMDLVNQHRGDHLKVGFALQFVTAVRDGAPMTALLPPRS
jgi:hypothetical protein